MAPTSVMNTGAFSQLISKDFKKIAFEEYARLDPEYTEIFKVDSFDGAYEREGGVVGLGAMQETEENEAFPYDGFEQGNEKTLVPRNFALGVSITHNMYMDDRTGIMKKIPAELGKSAAYTNELIAFDVLNGAFVSTYRTGIDGQPLCSASHPLRNGAVYGNMATGASSALSLTSLQARLDAMELTPNERGITIKNKGKLVIIPPQLRWAAEKYIGSEYNPDNANHEPNSKIIRDLQFKVVHFLTSTTAWFILADKSEYDLRFKWREKLAIQNGDDFKTGAAEFKATERCAASFVNWRGIDGSVGA